MRPWYGLYQTGRGQWAEGPEDLRRGHRSAHCAGHCALDTHSKWQRVGDGTRNGDSWTGRLEGLEAGGDGSTLGLPVPCQEGDTAAKLKEGMVLGRGCLAGDTAQRPRPHGAGEGPAVKAV